MRGLRRKDYVVQVVGDHMTVERRDGRPVRLAWDHLQALKNEAFGEDSTAVEVFPAESSKVDEVNRRHLWRLSEESVPKLGRKSTEPVSPARRVSHDRSTKNP